MKNHTHNNSFPTVITMIVFLFSGLHFGFSIEHCPKDKEPIVKPILSNENDLSCTGTTHSAATESMMPPAFPGAVGYGQNTLGGRGGQVIYVTNLNTNGPGSFKAACEASGPRIVVFRVGGQITFSNSDKITISNDYITIAGETAPGDGIVLVGDATIRNVKFVITADHVIIRNIAFRPGSGPELNCPDGDTDIDAIYNTGDNVIIDHCSMAFTTDEIFSSHQTQNVTVSNTLMTHPLQYANHYYNCESNHPEYGTHINHGRGPMAWGDNANRISATFYRNLIGHIEARAPATRWGHTQVINNITFNHETGMQFGGVGTIDRTDVIGNIFLGGNNSNYGNTKMRDVEVIQWNNSDNDYKMYLENNYGLRRQHPQINEWHITHIPNHGESLHRVNSHQTPNHPPKNDAIDNYYELPGTIGARARMWDSSKNTVDKIAVRDLLQRTQAGWIDHPSEIVPTWPNLGYGTATTYPDSDGDGIDDNWEAYFGDNLIQDAYTISNEYTNIECFLHELAGDDVLYSDIDNDGMPNYWEDKFNVSSPGADHDNDGLSNLNEYHNRTDPRNTDTDGDGASDNEEINFGVDPNNNLVYPSLFQDENNLLENAYFEHSSLTDWSSPANLNYALSPARTQLKSAKVTGRSSAEQGLDQNIKPILDTYGPGSYTFMGYMLSQYGVPNAAGMADIWLQYNNSWINAGSVTAAINDKTWMKLDKTINLNWSGTLQAAVIRFRTSNTIDFFVDDASLTTTNVIGCDPAAGTPCNDNDPCTTGDIVNSSCICLGMFADSDGDGVCDAIDICPGSNDDLDADNDGIPDGCDICDGNCTSGIPFCNISPPPSINGFVGDWVGHDYYDIDKTIAGSNPNNNDDLDARFKLSWDNDNFYIFVFILDDFRIKDSPSTEAWRDDSVELLIDGGGEGTTTHDANDRRILFRYDDNNIYNFEGGDTTGIEFSQHSGSYNEIEIKLPWSFIGVSPYDGMSIGFDIHVYDDDDGGFADTKMAWHDSTNTAWNDPSKLKTITLEQCFCPPTLTESQNQQIDQSRTVEHTIETNGQVMAGSNVEYTAGEYILMNPSFNVELGALFHAYIALCHSPEIVNTIMIQEDETGFCSIEGTIDNSNAGYTGSGFSNTTNELGTGINYKIDGSEGSYTFIWRHASTSDRPARLIVNGVVVINQIEFLSTGDWTVWNMTSVTIDLPAGAKDVRLESTGALGLVNIDYMEITAYHVSGANCNGN